MKVKLFAIHLFFIVISFGIKILSFAGTKFDLEYDSSPNSVRFCIPY